jgi:beta-glucosidase
MTRKVLGVIVLLAVAGAIAMAARRQNGTEARVDAILQNMTLEEKIDLIGGIDGFYLRGVPRLNVPRLKMADGPFGINLTYHWQPPYNRATAVAGGIALAASWNPELAERVGSEIGRDARARGVHFLLAPGVNIYLASMNGRNFEYFGEDPWLASRTAVGYIRGVQQQGVSATVKHFLGNNSEFDRHRVDVTVDERTLREIFLPAFEAAVKDARVGAIMTSYNLVNGQHMSQHAAINNDIVKKEWGHDGVIMSDWSSTYETLGVANGGIDIEMPDPKYLNRDALMPLIKEGKVSAATIDDKVRRILRVAVRFGWLDRDQTDKSVPEDNPGGREAALQSAREGMVLLKNAGNMLPLERRVIKTIAIIGPVAHPAVPVGGGSAAVIPKSPVSFRDGLVSIAGSGVEVKHHRGVAPLTELARQMRFTLQPDGKEPGIGFEGFDNIDLSGKAKLWRLEQHVDIAGPFFEGSDSGKGSSARWVGYYHAERAGAHHVATQTTRGDGGYRVFIDDKPVIDNWYLAKPMVTHASVTLTPGPHKLTVEQYRRAEWGNAATRLAIVHQDNLVDPAARAMAAAADVVIASVGFDAESEGEALDRTFSLPLGQDELIRALTDANRATIVAITSGGAVDMAGWLERVPALVQTWYPGQEGGTALAELLFGHANFSGRLPATFERRIDDNPVRAHYYPAEGSSRIEYKNGVFTGYRAYEKHNVKPLFPFGYGLSYTTFAYSNLRVSPTSVTFDLKNTGAREGADVAQVYVSEKQPAVPRPPKELKGFAKVTLRPGETKTVTVPLDRRSFSYFDASSHQWRVNPGEFEILVGRSSADTPLKGSVQMR